MLEALQISQRFCDIVTRRLMVRQDATHSEDRVPTFEHLGRVDDGRPMIADIVGKMYKYVEFYFFNDPVGVD